MENNIINSENIVEVTEKVATAGSGKGFKRVIGVGAIGLVCYGAYKFIITPALAKVKAKKEQQEAAEREAADYATDDTDVA